MNLRTQKKTCKGCCAGKHHKCELGYRVEWKAYDEYGFTVFGVPLEPCPKPLTISDAIYAQQWYQRIGKGATMSEEHAKISPSKMASYEKCARYESSPAPSEAAERGTRIHKAVELNRPEMLADEEERNGAMRALHHLQEFRKPGFQEFAEAKLKGALTYGTADRLFLGEKHAVVWDLKAGAIEVDPAVENLQLGTYAELTFEMYPQLETVEVAIDQVFVNEYMDRHVYHKEDIGRILQRMERVVARRSDPTTPPTPDASICQWCAAKAACPAMNTLAVETARSTHGIPLPTNWMPGTVKTPLERAKLQVLGMMLCGDNGWWDQIKYENAHCGEEIPGFKLVSRAGNWKVDDQDAVLEWLRKKGVTDAELWAFAKINAKKAVESLAEANSMCDAATMMQELASIGACSQGEPIQYLKKSFKCSETEQLKGMIQ